MQFFRAYLPYRLKQVFRLCRKAPHLTSPSRRRQDPSIKNSISYHRDFQHLRILHGNTLVAQTIRDPKGGLFQLKMALNPYAKSATKAPRPIPELDVIVWHRRLAHLGEDNVRKLAKMAEGIKIRVGTLVAVCRP